MIKAIGGVLAITMAAAGLTACAGMESGAPKTEAVMGQYGGMQSSAEILENQRCNSQEFLGLVGQNLNMLPADKAKTARVLPAGARVDQQPFVPTRLTVMYDTSNNMITQVRCG